MSCESRCSGWSAAGSGMDLTGAADTAGLITWDVSADSTIEHQRMTGARKGDLQAELPGEV